MLHNNVVAANAAKSGISTYSNDLNYDIKAELESLGVIELSAKEVCEQFPQITSRSLNIDVPDDENGILWYLDANYTRTYNGTSYNVAVLRAIPDGSYSGPLLNEIDNITYSSRNSFTIGSRNLLKYSIEQGISKTCEFIVEDIPFVGTALSLKSAISAVISGTSSSTKINELHASASVLAGTGVKFVYVNRASASSSSQSLQLVTAMYDADGDIKIPSCTVKIIMEVLLMSAT